jgi:hypothetical protein
VISERDAVKGKTLVSVVAVIEGEEHRILLMWEGDMPIDRLRDLFFNVELNEDRRIAKHGR